MLWVESLAMSRTERLTSDDERTRIAEPRMCLWKQSLDDLLALRKITGVQDGDNPNPVDASARRSISDTMVKAGLEAFASGCFSSNFVTVVEDIYIAMRRAAKHEREFMGGESNSVQDLAP
jgi:hypothetical protein